MMLPPALEWLSASEIAALSLPGLPSTAGKVLGFALMHGWGAKVDQDGVPLVRRRQGKGGGNEYHVSLLPARARAELGWCAEPKAPANSNEPEPAEGAERSAWDWYDRQTAKVKAEAERRAAILDQVEALARASLTKSRAVAEVSASVGVAERTIWDWCKLIEGVDRADWLPALAPRRGGGRPPVKVDAELWKQLLSDYLRFSRPSFSSCYRRTAEKAKADGKSLPDQQMLWRKFKREIPRDVVTLKRYGAEALRSSIDPQERTVADLHAMEIVNIDGHKFDVWVALPNGKVVRPILIGIQDVYSRKVLAWRLALSEDAATARLVFADLFERYGIPKGLLADNGRAFASKWLTGGVPTRFRFKVKPDEQQGLLTTLGVQIHWALPYRGQSKPIERAFRDFCDDIAKHPALEGAYTGNAPDNKPANYGTRAVPWDEFERLVADGIERHNARPGRDTETAKGGSFDQAFEASRLQNPVRVATKQDLRLALLPAERIRVTKTGAIRLFGNKFWSLEARDLAGREVIVRFDPERLHKPIHVYDMKDRFLLTVSACEKTGFLDVKAAKERAKLEARVKRTAREKAEALGLLAAHEVAALLPDAPASPEPPTPRIIQPVRVRGGALPKAAVEPSEAGEVVDFMDKFLEGVRRLPE